MNYQVESPCFQDFMTGNICFGCGKENHDGLHVRSHWLAQEPLQSYCHWVSQEKYHGWANLLNGGIIATLIDCHCMATAMAYAYRLEARELDSFPLYRYATGTLSVRYIKPASNLHPVELFARVVEVKNKKTTLLCEVFSQGIKTAEAEVIALRVYDSSQDNHNNPFVE